MRAKKLTHNRLKQIINKTTRMRDGLHNLIKELDGYQQPMPNGVFSSTEEMARGTDHVTMAINWLYDAEAKMMEKARKERETRLQMSMSYGVPQ